eukprot:9776-Heterococcus_DN1.PRE.1
MVTLPRCVSLNFALPCAPYRRMRLDVNYSRRQAWMRCRSFDRIGFLTVLNAAQIISKAQRPLSDDTPEACLIAACDCHKEQQPAPYLPVRSFVQHAKKARKHVVFNDSTFVQLVPSRGDLTSEQQDGMYWSSADLQEMRKNYFLWKLKL